MLRSILYRAPLLALLALVAVASGCASVNTVSEGADSALMLRGHDPVAYFTQNKAVRGDPAIKATHEGVTYRFASAEHRAQFQASPTKFVPMYGGFCANGVVYAIPLGGEPDAFRIIDGRLYIFGGGRSRLYFEMDLERNRKLADHYWDTEMKGGSAFWQSWKRRIFRVEHYKTNAQLAAEYEARQKKK